MCIYSSYTLNVECLTFKTIYRADVSNDVNSDKNIYFGLEDTPFKKRYWNHTMDFKYEKYENSTELANYICQLKRNNVTFPVKYLIASKVHGNPS